MAPSSQREVSKAKTFFKAMQCGMVVLVSVTLAWGPNGGGIPTISAQGCQHGPGVCRSVGNDCWAPFSEAARCVEGYTPSAKNALGGYECCPNRCTCNGGTAATGPPCPSNGAQHCTSCNDGYVMSGTTCRTEAEAAEAAAGGGDDGAVVVIIIILIVVVLGICGCIICVVVCVITQNSQKNTAASKAPDQQMSVAAAPVPPVAAVQPIGAVQPQQPQVMMMQVQQSDGTMAQMPCQQVMQPNGVATWVPCQVQQQTVAQVQPQPVAQVQGVAM